MSENVHGRMAAMNMAVDHLVGAMEDLRKEPGPRAEIADLSTKIVDEMWSMISRLEFNCRTWRRRCEELYRRIEEKR